MSRTQAHAILDAARAGAQIPAKVINRALIASGDLRGQWSRPQAVVVAQTLPLPSQLPKAEA